MSRVHRPRRQWRTLIEEQRVGGLTRRVAIRRVSSKWLLLSVGRDGFTHERGACRRAAAVRFSRASGTLRARRVSIPAFHAGLRSRRAYGTRAQARKPTAESRSSRRGSALLLRRSPCALINPIYDARPRLGTLAVMSRVHRPRSQWRTLPEQQRGGRCGVLPPGRARRSVGQD